MKSGFAAVMVALLAVFCAAPALALAEPASIPIDEDHFPDANFREVVETYDTDNTGSLSDSEIASVTTISCAGRNISNLAGIEYFTSLESLVCYGNNLTSLDLSQNTALKSLYCFQNSFTELDLSNNANLTLLDCSENSIELLDLTGNPKLSSLKCDENKLTSLNTTANTELTFLVCGDNQLASLNLANNTKLENLECWDN